MGVNNNCCQEPSRWCWGSWSSYWVSFSNLVRGNGSFVSLFFLPSLNFEPLFHRFLMLLRTVCFHQYLSIRTLVTAGYLGGNIGSLQNIRKNGLSLECSFGIKLYAMQANGTILSHSKFPDTCLAMQDLRKWWKPSVLPLLWGWHSREYTLYWTPSCFCNNVK